MKILLLEDDIMLNEAITQYLTTVGHAITPVKDGDECLAILDKEKFDLLIFDINVPQVDGLTILENLHNQKRMVPTIFISALIDIEDISRAFDIGCHDYLKKPFHLKELELRIQKEMLSLKNTKSKHITLSKNYSIDLETSTLYYNKQAQQLTNKKLQIIKHLSLNVGVIITLEILREYIWNNEPVSDATIRTEVSRLKKSLNEDFIENIKGVGYTINKYVTTRELEK